MNYLRAATADPDPRISMSADELARLLRANIRMHTRATTEATGQQHGHRLDAHTAYVLLERPSAALYRFLSRWRVRSHALLVTWSWMALSLAVAASAAIVYGHWMLAAVLVAARTLGSVFAGTTRYPSDAANEPYGPETPASWVERCVVSHLGDALCLVAVAHALSLAGRAMWSLLVVLATCVMLVATLTRVGAYHVDVLMERKATERIARRASLLGALLLSVLVQPVVPHAGVPILALAALGPIAYAMLEFGCTHRRLVAIRPPNAARFFTVPSTARPDWPAATSDTSDVDLISSAGYTI